MGKPIWKCKVKGCDFTAPPTKEGHDEIVGHQLHHSLEGTPKEKRGYHLIDQGTGVLLARNLKKARAKGLLEPTSPPTPTPPVVPPGKPADSAYQRGYDKGYDEGYDAGSKETEEAIRKVAFDIRIPQYGGIRGHIGDLFHRTDDNGQKDEEARCHLTCELCKGRYGVTKAMVKHVTLVGSASVECPYCKTESYYNFWNNPALEQLCSMPAIKRSNNQVTYNLKEVR